MVIEIHPLQPKHLSYPMVTEDGGGALPMRINSFDSCVHENAIRPKEAD